MVVLDATHAVPDTFCLPFSETARKEKHFGMLYQTSTVVSVKYPWSFPSKRPVL